MTIIKRSFTLAGHKTSISIEPIFWILLKYIAKQEECSVSAWIEKVDAKRKDSNLSSALRVSLLEWVLTRSDFNKEFYEECQKLEKD